MKLMRILAPLAALTLIAGCGNLAGILGNPTSNPTYPTQSGQRSDIQGTINNVDTRAQRIDLTVSSQSGSNGRQYTSSVYYNSGTRVYNQNQTTNVSNLRRGDQIDVRAYDSGNGQYVADTISLMNVGYGSPGTYPGSSYPSNQNSDIVGTVSYVDTSAKRIDLATTYGMNLRTNQTQNNYSVYYDSRTQVLYQGQSYSPTALERGDQIDAHVYDNGRGQNYADTITVTRNIRQ